MKRKRSATLPTTTRNSKAAGVTRGWRAAHTCLYLSFVVLLSGCVPHTEATEFFELTPQTAIDRAMQTRMYETSDRLELLSASAAVLQDLGFQVEESQRDVGFLRATKERSAREYGQYITRFLVAIVSAPLALFRSGPIILPVDLHQKIAASMVIRPLHAEGKRQEVRIMFYRVIWKGDGAAGESAIAPGAQQMEMLHDPVLYQAFFAKLSKAVFLEAFTI